jgi:hypothetical protein
MLARTTGRSLIIGVARDGAIAAAFTAPMILPLMTLENVSDASVRY